jgi:hypothetical protein
MAYILFFFVKLMFIGRSPVQADSGSARVPLACCVACGGLCDLTENENCSAAQLME